MNRLLALTLLLAAPLPALATPQVTTWTHSQRVYNPPNVIDLDWMTYGYSNGPAPSVCPFAASGFFSMVSGKCQFVSPGSPANGTRFSAWTAFKFDYDHDIAACGMNIDLEYALGGGLGNVNTVMFYSNNGGLTWSTVNLAASGANWKYWYVGVGPVGDFRVVLGRSEPLGNTSRELRWHELYLYLDPC